LGLSLRGAIDPDPIVRIRIQQRTPPRVSNPRHLR
jgi:hypothetical protein